ncbi:MAG: acetyl-CoA carboxylase biotin carboxyl carrier protein [Betaproteobacteria bacterium]|nr:acetyl-CoA carboxylase biotin carboxyl carrier protein [Betaproteobacteria bacterium]NBT75578.1 acetyl-CoA carboxylase biotin carboxyl carrier protein [Betaproteobacteria bacterium]NCA15463.1 acetyl-CoA carboxylase biotin carboxyl carrier protein [Betaproteobacteria bacterium]
MPEDRPVRELSFAELREIASILRASQTLTEFSLKFGNVELSISTRLAQRPTQMEPLDSSTTELQGSWVTSQVSSSQELSDALMSKSDREVQASTLRGIVVRSPMVGTFYRAREPGAAPFVTLGDHVKKGDVICLIEVMKLINSITAEQDGQVVEIVVENGAAVEFGDPLMCIEPA